MSLPLNRGRVLEAALWVVDHEGLTQLTMRRVGRRLGFEAMALYRYVVNRDDLLGGVIDFVFDELDEPSEGGDWQTTLTAAARDFRQTVLRHVNLAPLIAAQALTPPTNAGPSRRSQSVDAVLASLKRGGYSASDAALIHRLVTGFTLGHIATQLHPCSEETQPLEVADAGSNVVALRRVATVFDSGSSEFDLGLAVLLDGITSQVPRT